MYLYSVGLLLTMPSTGCCVPECNGLGGHRFPRDKQLKKLWMIAIRRDKWHPTATSVVCHRHFTDIDYRSETTSGGLCYVSDILGVSAPHMSSLLLRLGLELRLGLSYGLAFRARVSISDQ